MSKSREYIFVLWGDRFEEAIATIFITELRKAGLWVKMVGLSQKRTSGVHGLTLVPDLTLEEALPLANQTTCIVIPCQSPRIKRLANDPRLREFFAQAQANQATFVSSQDAVNLGLLPATVKNIVIYPHNEDLITFAREVADQFK